MRALRTLPLVMIVALAGCRADPAASNPPTEQASARVGSGPAAGGAPGLDVAAAPIVHDGGIVFLKPPTGGFAVGGQLHVASSYAVAQAAGVQVRLVMAGGRSLLATPNDRGAFRFIVPKRDDPQFGVCTIQIERENGSRVAVWFDSGSAKKRWAKFAVGQGFDLGMVTEREEGASPAINPLERLDSDGDGMVDAVDPDDDNDGVPDSHDEFGYAYDAAENHDNDKDGLGDNLDGDDDNDGLMDALDQDDDGDGKPDSEDEDDDGDGVPDLRDLPQAKHDLDHDGLPDEADPDDDGDGVPDAVDPDRDNDGTPNAQDDDDDQDGLSDGREAADRDGDGVADFFDPAPEYAAGYTLPADFDWAEVDRKLGADVDFDLVADKPAPAVPDANRDGIPDAKALAGAGQDRDRDGMPDGWDTDGDGDGTSDRKVDEGPWNKDTDGDGVPDGEDVQPEGADPGEPADWDTKGANGAEEGS